MKKMKAMNRMTAMLFCLIVSMTAAAQGKIDKIVKELESKGVEATVVVKRNSESKKMYLRIQTYKFKSAKGKYANQLVEAFKTESDQADEVVMNKPVTSFSWGRARNDGSTKRYGLIFNEKKVRKMYVLDVTSYKEGDPSVRLQIVTRDADVPANKNDHDIYKYEHPDLSAGDGLNLDNLGDVFSQKGLGFLAQMTDSLRNIDWNGIGKTISESMKSIDWGEVDKSMDSIRIRLKPYKNMGSKNVVVVKGNRI